MNVRAKVVICDCTGRNPNVFYEIGLAHALGRDVILITQSENDVPFDLRHLRYIRYLNNWEGFRISEHNWQFASRISRRPEQFIQADDASRRGFISFNPRGKYVAT